jgi:hypothetical protein
MPTPRFPEVWQCCGSLNFRRVRCPQ